MVPKPVRVVVVLVEGRDVVEVVLGRLVKPSEVEEFDGGTDVALAGKRRAKIGVDQ